MTPTVQTLETVPIVAYELGYDDVRQQAILLERRRTNEDVFSWRIVRGEDSELSKVKCNGWHFFEMRGLNSGLPDSWWDEHRWESAEEALQFWNDNQDTIVMGMKLWRPE